MKVNLRASPKELLEDYTNDFFGYTHELEIANGKRGFCWFCANRVEMEEQIFAEWMGWA